MKERILAAKISMAVLAAAIATMTPLSTHAGIPVLDGTNLSQNILSTLEAVAQTAKQIEQYQTQLQQYENQLLNTTAPASHIWDQAQTTINGLLRATDTLDHHRTRLGSLNDYLDKFQDADFYRASPCFNSTGCTDAQWQVVLENQRLASEAQKLANDAAIHGLDEHQENLQSDARKLQRLQSAAQGADGQLAAIGYANQFASNHANQLLQIRSLLIAQQNAVVTKMQADADRKAMEQAAHEQLFEMGAPTDRSSNRRF